MQVAVRRDDENVVGFDRQIVGDQRDRHAGEPGQHGVQLRRQRGDVVDDDNRHAHVGR